METNLSRALRQRVRLDALPHLANEEPISPYLSIMEVALIFRSIDDHFLLLCQILGRAERAAPGALEDAAEYERKIEERRLCISTEVERCKEHNDSKISLEGEMQMLEMANGTEFMREYWITALERAKDLKHGITTSIRSFEWKAWIRALEHLSVPLVEKMNIPPEVIERRGLNGLISKVEFLDKLLDGEFANPEMDLGERSLHLGEAINEKVKKITGISPHFVERRLKTPIISDSSMAEGYPTVRAIVLLSTLLATIPGYLAWGFSIHRPGTTNDADFWSLIQSSIMQFQNILVIIASIWMRKDLSFKGWFWTWVFLSLSCVCPTLALVLYLYVPTEWSTAIAFLGAAAQGFIVLQSSFTETKARKKND